MSIVDAFWMSIGASGRLVDLSRDECLETCAFEIDSGPCRWAGSRTPPTTGRACCR